MSDSNVVTARDLFLAQELSEAAAARFLDALGFHDGAEADQHLQQLADDLPTRLALGELADMLVEALAAAPDPDAAVVGFCRYVSSRTPAHAFIRDLKADPRALELLTQLFGSSPFLGEILIRNPEYFHWLRRELSRPAPDRVDYRDAVESLELAEPNTARRVAALKRFQRREMLRIAARDLLGTDTLTSTTAQLSDLADTVTDGVLRAATRDVADGEDPLPFRFAVIGMGKLGGRELNYSSDVDLIYLYEPRESSDSDVDRLVRKLGQRLTALLGEHTAEGYFYRVDLRLRPMGQAGNIAYSLPQCAQYYESHGETFERFALIKARPVAGDPSLGARFVDLVQPFVYRRYLDHAAIEELARYKARSDREHASGPESERNVKAGRGGIREVELFAQIFQLIYGGEKPGLRTGHTLTALDRLRADRFIEAKVEEGLRDAYLFLRTIEHRLQNVQDNQTHSLSDDARELAVMARRLALDTPDALLEQLEQHRATVHGIYAKLLEEGPGDNSLAGRNIFRLLAGEMEDAEAQQRLESVGVRDPGGMLASIRALDAVPSHAHARSTTRNLLANLLAQLLADGMVDERPATVLNRFERVVGHSGAAASLYRTLLENDDLRRRLFVALAAGDLFAERLSRYPELLDFLASVTLDTDAFRTAVAEAFAEVIETAPDVEPRLDPLRRAKAIEEFKVLAEWLVKRELDLLNDKLSLVADAAIDAAARCASDVHGPVPDASSHRAGWAAFALGKLGGRELTVHSDLDLVFLYAGETSDAPRFKRHQKFVKTIYDVLGRVTAAGSVYELDTRLRPEGKKGALAIPLAAFECYIEERAEIWERMAWTRARFVAGDPAFAADVQGVVNRFVYGAWASEVPAYARHIRARIERELALEADGSRLDLKRGHGGLADIDFLLQVLQLREGRTREEFRVTGTRRLLGALPDTEFLAPDDAAALRRAYALFRELETVLRIDADASIGTLTTDAGALDTLARRLRTPVSGADLLARYRETTREVRAIYEAGMNRLERD